jgi:hypothetical protein
MFDVGKRVPRVEETAFAAVQGAHPLQLRRRAKSVGSLELAPTWMAAQPFGHERRPSPTLVDDLNDLDDLDDLG